LRVAGKGRRKGDRKPRADAERNRLLLLEAAKAAFAEKGSAASLDEIARAAGVGIGTLYRHFPTRDALIAAVYQNESDQLARAAARFAEAMPPIDALRAWMILFVDYLATKHGMTEVLNSIVGGPSGLYAASGPGITGAFGMLVDRGIASGDVRADIDPLDLLRAIAGVANGSAGPNSGEAAKRMVDILIAGVTTPRAAGRGR
jgi:AcrR family transcriptional regulator